MANTRFNYDDCRTMKRLQQQTDPGRWILNVPGNGADPCYIEDPQIIIQKWGANLRTNTINLESNLKGLNQPLSRDCMQNNYVTTAVSSSPLTYPSCKSTVEQSRVTHPAWTYRDLEQTNWYYPQLNPQENVCITFQNNLSTRILEKNNYVTKLPCFPFLR